MDRPTKPSGRHAVRLRWDEIITRLSYRFNFLAIRARHTDESIIFVAKNPARSSSSATNISSSGSLWTPGCLRHAPIDSGQKVRQLRDADRDDAVCQRGP